jgi:hypothetical protein
VPTVHTEHLLVPDPSRTSLLVLDGDVPVLPTWDTEELEVRLTVEHARRLCGIEAPYLRAVMTIGDIFGDAPVAVLIEFDAPEPGWQPPSPLRWLSFDELPTTDLEPALFRNHVRSWASDLARGHADPHTPEWSRPGWFGSTSAWLVDQLARLGLRATGRIEQLGGWPVSAILAADTDAGGVVLKTMPPVFGHEPALTATLAREHPGRVPDVLAIDRDRRLLLMGAFGGSMLGDEEPARWGDGLSAMGEIQRAWIGRRAELAALGLPDHGLAAIAQRFESIVTDVDASPGLDPADRERLVGHLPLYAELVDRLAAFAVPETLIHGDMHPWNVQRDGERLIVFDWSDACWSHPFFDVVTFTARTADAHAGEQMRLDYLAGWSDRASPADLRQALRWAEPLAELRLSLIWRELQAVFGRGSAFPFVDSGVERHLLYVIKATEAMADRSPA